MRPLDIEFVTHACLKIRGAFGTLVCDPWLLNEPVANFVCWKFPAAVLPPEAVVRDVDYVYLTHAHEDHFHVPSLDLFPRDVTIILPALEWHASLRAQTMEIVLRQMGFANIRKLKGWETLQLGGNTPLTVIPGARSRWYDWENSGFLLRHHDALVLNMNDNVSDPELCRQIVSFAGDRIDIGFVQAIGCSMYPGCFRMSEEAMRAEVAARQVSMADQRRMIELIEPRWIAPMAGDFAWYDERYFHNNWTSRATPKLFRETVARDYPERDIQVAVLYPSDRWSPAGGVARNHPEIDWDNYLDAMRAEQRRFQPKIDAINRYIDGAATADLEARSRAFTRFVERHVTHDHIDFAARFRHTVEGPEGGFSFVLKASPEAGFAIDWADDAPVDQTLYVPQRIWAAILEGRLLWTEIQWNGQAEQHVEFRYDLARFWYWLEYYVSLNSKVTQALVEPHLYPHLPRLDARRGVFPTPADFPLAAAAE